MGRGGVGSLSTQGQMVSRKAGACSGYQVALRAAGLGITFPGGHWAGARACRSFPRGLGGHCPEHCAGAGSVPRPPSLPRLLFLPVTWVGRDTPLPPPGGAG